MLSFATVRGDLNISMRAAVSCNVDSCAHGTSVRPLYPTFQGVLRDAMLAVSPEGSAMEVFVLISPNTTLTGSYDYGEVARSILIAIAASYAALDLAGRVTAARGRARTAWSWTARAALSSASTATAASLGSIKATHLRLWPINTWVSD